MKLYFFLMYTYTYILVKWGPFVHGALGGRLNGLYYERPWGLPELKPSPAQGKFFTII